MFPSKQFDFSHPADDHRSSEFLELYSSDIRGYQGYVAEAKIRPMLDKNQQKSSLSDFGDLDNHYFDLVASPPFQDTLKGKDFQLKEYENRSPVASLGIIRDFTSRSRKLIGNKIHVQIYNSEAPEANDKKMSTNARIQLAGQRFIDFYSSKADEISQLSHPYPASFSGLSDDEAKDIELLLTLLTSAEKTGQGQFDHASKLVELCNKMSSNEGNPVERLVYYFSEAIHEKINREIGRVAHSGLERMQMFDIQEALMNVDMSIIAFHQKVPLSQVCQFTAVHMIIAHVKEARKIHVVDLEIRTGMQYTVMMQALASHSEWHIEHFKITAIGTRSESKIKDTCKHLADFAKSMNIPFSFKIVMVADVLDFSINLLELNEDEKVAVYSPFMLSSLIVKPNRLEYLMREIWKINPCILVITEVEANHTSPVFVNRFTEALFFYGALFDSMSDCFSNDDLNRKVTESVFYSQAIRNIVAAEGDERKIRHVGVSVWRAFFERFGMVEIELTAASLSEAKMLISNFDCRSSCTLVVDDDDHSSESWELCFSDTDVYQDYVTENEARPILENDQQKPFLSNFRDLDNLYVDFSCPPFQDMLKGTLLRSKDNGNGSPVASVGIVTDFASRSRKVDGENIHVPSCNSRDLKANDEKLSTNEKIRMAGHWFIESYSSKDDRISCLSHPFAIWFPGISDDEAKDVELLLMLLDSAEKTCQRQFDCASKLVELCNNMSSNEGNTVERLVYYFSKAISEKINREIGRVAPDGLEKMQLFDLQEALMSIETSVFAFHQKVPLVQVCQFNAIHTIMESVREARKVHVIDLEIRNGMNYSLLLQALASRREQHVEHIKITAIGTRAESKIKITGKRLADLAQSMNIPFSFKIVMVSDVLDFNIDLLELDDDEKVAVYSPFFLSTLIAKPNRLEYLMRMLRKINPCITVITEVEANHTSPVFVNRFIEALFFYGAFFDSMSHCLGHDDRDRKVSETVYFGQTIRNIVAAEGEERTIRHMGVDVWRAFFVRFGMLEVELSDASFFEAELLISNFECGSSCALRVDGGCLIVDWKDVPVFSVSAWKFV